MPQLTKITGLLCQLFFWCLLFTACNNAADDKTIESTDSTIVIPVDTPVILPKYDSIPPVDSMPGIDSSISLNPKEPEASIAYAYKNKMKKGDKELIQMHVQLNKPLEQLEGNLRNELEEQKAKETASSDSSIIKSLTIAGGKYLLATVDKYDTTVFFIEKIFGEEKQELRFTKPNKWVWRVTAKKETSKSEIFIMVKTEDANGVQHESDMGILPIEITVSQLKESSSFIERYGWLLLSGAALIILLLVVARFLKKRRIKELNSRIYFSYAWSNNKEKTFIDKLYLSLKAAGFNVIRDKVNLEYRGLISGFMKDIGKGNIIIVSISDKYLTSRFCMYELYEVYRNCGMSKEAFVKKIFPIREEEINLSDASIVDHYIDYWKAEELKLEAIVKDVNQETTSEQFAQYEAIKRIESELGNLLYFLSDMNSLNAEMLSENDFAQIKQSLADAVKNLNDSLS